MIWIASTHRFDEWNDYFAWLFGIAATVYTFIASKAVPKISLLAGTIAGRRFGSCFRSLVWTRCMRRAFRWWPVHLRRRPSMPAFGS